MAPVTKHFRKRNAILSYLQRTDSHPSAEMVYNQLKAEIPDLSLGTVYRNLSMFKQQGIIASLGTVNCVERFDGNTAPHVHFVCDNCDSVLDLPMLDVPEDLASAAAEQLGGYVNTCQLTFTVVCKDCIEKQHGGETA